MKNILTILMILSMLSSNAFAFSLISKDESGNKSSIKTYISEKSEEREIAAKKRKDIKEIKKLLKQLVEYSNEHNVEKVATLYDKKYRSFDGFKYDTFVKMLKETFEVYENLTYKSSVKDIILYEDKAVVNLIDTTTATLSSKKDDKKQQLALPDINTGHLRGECNYAIYLQKINDEWKITGDNVISEVTSIKYGSAKEYPMEFSAPLTVPYDSEYCLTLKMKQKKGDKVVASLGKEEILYPSAEPKDVFRKLPKDGILERVVRSNKKGFNEYAIASVGITKMDVAQDFSIIEFKMTGLAFLMQRVNLYQDINPTREVKEEKKENAENKG